MLITVDGGSLNLSNKYGNQTFTTNFLQAAEKYDKENQYKVYIFDNNVYNPTSSENIQYKKLSPSFAWMKFRVGIEEVLHPSDIFLALNQAIPSFGTKKTIVFSHGLSFLYFLELYPNDFNRLYKQLYLYLQKANIIIVSSSKVQKEIWSYLGREDKRIKVIPFGIPFDFQTHTKRKRENFFLFVGNNQPIKNVDHLVQVFLSAKIPDYKLYLLGPFENYKDKRIKVFSNATRSEIKNLYAKTSGYISLSKYESFNFPIIEALSQKSRVIAYESAVIPEMENYVHLVKKENDLQNSMISFSQSIEDNAIDLKKLKKEFSWKTYIERIKSLYNEI